MKHELLNIKQAVRSIGTMNKPFYIQLLGPTATGKTDLAIALAQTIPSQIISVDSVMVYRGFDVGSAKPTIDEQRGIPHHLIDIESPEHLVFNGYEFCQQALELIHTICNQKKCPILVGGTMMYAHLLQNIYPQGMPKTDLQLRHTYEEQAKTKEGRAALYRRLIKESMNPVHINANDTKRIIRQLEILHTNNLANHVKVTMPEVLSVHIHVNDREAHLKHMENRFKYMLDKNFIDECEALMPIYDKHYNHPVFKSIGYAQAMAYLKGQFDFDTMIEKANIATRQYAKKQMTWLRSWQPKAELVLKWGESQEEMIKKIVQYVNDRKIKLS